MARRRKSPAGTLVALVVIGLLALNPGLREWAIGQYMGFWVEKAERRGERIRETIDEQMQRMQTPTVTPSPTTTS